MALSTSSLFLDAASPSGLPSPQQWQQWSRVLKSASRAAAASCELREHRAQARRASFVGVQDRGGGEGVDLHHDLPCLAQLLGEDEEVDAGGEELEDGDGELLPLEGKAPPGSVEAATHRGAVSLQHGVASQVPDRVAAPVECGMVACRQQRGPWRVEEDAAPLAEVSVASPVGFELAVRIELAFASCLHGAVQVLHHLAGKAGDVDDVLKEAHDLLVYDLGVQVPSSTVWMRSRTRSALSFGTHMMPSPG